MNSLSFLMDGTHPTWIIRRHHPVQNDNTTNNPEPKVETSKPVKIGNWITANAERVEANRKLFQQQISSKSPAISATFKETIEEYERMIGGMLQQRVQNANSHNENAAKVMIKDGASPRGTSQNSICKMVPKFRIDSVK
ncbi:unnamed protein product [Onchocerca flexuosa]|uniref:Ovule protein n=1 Tax=Onchocerca flexuosa TaxID=387005 RepID=A0A183H6W8_9BILA|nr:unnamed protein product [Onchocerca flexuosa]